jgi:SCP-2 sterol transfer family
VPQGLTDRSLGLRSVAASDTLAGVIRYLSLEWIEALTAEVAGHTALQQLASSTDIGVTQVVTDGPEGNVVYHLQVGDGSAAFGPGAAYPEDVRFEQTWETAVAVATHKLNAQEAFINGRILLNGDQQKLMSNGAIFEALDSVFSVVRARTTYE